VAGHGGTAPITGAGDLSLPGAMILVSQYDTLLRFRSANAPSSLI